MGERRGTKCQKKTHLECSRDSPLLQNIPQPHHVVLRGQDARGEARTQRVRHRRHLPRIWRVGHGRRGGRRSTPGSHAVDIPAAAERERGRRGRERGRRTRSKVSKQEAPRPLVLVGTQPKVIVVAVQGAQAALEHRLPQRQPRRGVGRAAGGVGRRTDRREALVVVKGGAGGGHCRRRRRGAQEVGVGTRHVSRERGSRRRRHSFVAIVRGERGRRRRRGVRVSVTSKQARSKMKQYSITFKYPLKPFFCNKQRSCENHVIRSSQSPFILPSSK